MKKYIDVDTGVEIIQKSIQQDLLEKLKYSLFYVQKGTVGLADKSPDKDQEANQLGKEEFIEGMKGQKLIDQKSTL